MDGWTVEPFSNGWCVMDEDGEEIIHSTEDGPFRTRQQAEDWLAFRQEQAAMDRLAIYCD